MDVKKIFHVFVNFQRMNRDNWFPESLHRSLENFVQAFVPQIIKRLKDLAKIAKVTNSSYNVPNAFARKHGRQGAVLSNHLLFLKFISKRFG